MMAMISARIRISHSVAGLQIHYLLKHSCIDPAQDYAFHSLQSSLCTEPKHSALNSIARQNGLERLVTEIMLVSEWIFCLGQESLKS